jgi:hypothetical protein
MSRRSEGTHLRMKQLDQTQAYGGTLARSADYLGGEKGERDGHVDTTDTSSLTQRN